MGFDKEGDDLYFNEWYGYVTYRIAREIKKKKLSPMDFNDRVAAYGGIKRWDTALRDGEVIE